MEIRKMTSGDYDGVCELWPGTYRLGRSSLDDSREGIEKYLRRIPHTCFVACRNNRIIGAVLSGHDGRRGYLYHMAVAETEQNQGIGSALLETALEEEGIHKAALVVFSDSGNENRFWEKRGFTLRQDRIYRNREIKTSVRFDT